MMATVRRALRRFGGAALLDHFPKHEDRDLHGPAARDQLDARLRAIEVEVEVQARRPLNFKREG